VILVILVFDKSFHLLVSFSCENILVLSRAYSFSELDAIILVLVTKISLVT